MNQTARIFIAGHRGMLGRALVRFLRRAGYENLVLAPRASLDLTREAEVEAFFERERPEYVFAAAARVGGIVANQTTPVEFIRTNLAIELSLVEAAHRFGVGGLVLFGSSCMYPIHGSDAIREESLLSGPLEPTSQAYAVSKIAGAELCRSYRIQYGSRFFTMVPATLYGPYDHYHSDRAHVIPALLTRFHAAKLEGRPYVTVLGSGAPLREFLHCDDAAEAAVFLMRSGASLDVVNVGSGEEIAIRDLAQCIARVVGYGGEIRFDSSKPDGAPRKLLDSSRILSLGWRPRIAIDAGLAQAYSWYLEHFPDGPTLDQRARAEEGNSFSGYS